MNFEDSIKLPFGIELNGLEVSLASVGTGLVTGACAEYVVSKVIDNALPELSLPGKVAAFIGTSAMSIIVGSKIYDATSETIDGAAEAISKIQKYWSETVVNRTDEDSVEIN